MKKTVCVLLVLVLLAGLGASAFADDLLDVVGSVEGQVYTSKTLNLTGVFPDDWKILNDEELAAEMEFPEGYAGREGVAKLLEEIFYTCALSAEATDGSKANMNMMIQDTLYPDLFTEQDYYDALAESIAESITAQGYENVEVSQSSCVISDENGENGVEHVMCVVNADLGELRLWEYNVYVKAGQYIGLVNIFAPSKEQADEILSFFHLVEPAA